MPSHLKRKGGLGGVGGDSSSNSAHVLLHPSQTPHSHYTTGSMMSSGFAEPYQDYEDYASEPNSRRASLSLPQRRSRSRPSTPPVELGHGRNDSDYGNAYGIDLGGLSTSSSSSSLSGLPVISHERLGRAGLRRLDINGLPLRRRKGVNIWKLLIRVLSGLGLAWVVFGLVRIGASQVRIIYSHWMNIPIELLDLCKDAEWAYHQPTPLTTDPSLEASPINQLHFASAFFEMPADEPLYLLSQGNFSYGTVEFLPDTSGSAPSWDTEWSRTRAREQKIRVEVDAKYRDPSVFGWARVCMIGGESTEDGTPGAEVPKSGAGREPTKDSILGQVGVMVWTPETSAVTPKEHQLHLKIRVYIPPRLTSRRGVKRTQLPSIVTDLPTFEHRVGDLAPAIDFRRFSARTQKSIHVESLRAESIFLQTANKSVHGAMEAWSSVHVETLNADLDVNVTLTPAPLHLHARYTELFMKTSNAPLKSSVILNADPRTPAQNVFKVTARTSNGPLIVIFPPTPSHTPSRSHAVRSVDDSYLDLHALEHDPSNAQPQSELALPKPVENASIFLEDSGSGGEKDARSDSPVLASPGRSFISTSSFSPSRPSRSSSFPSSPWPILRFDGYTMHGPAYVDLPPTFEGHFTLRTSNRHRPRVIVRRGGFDKGTENIDGVDLVREITDEVSEGGEVVKGTMRLVRAEHKKPKSSESDSMDIDAPPEESEDEGQSPTPRVPSDKGKAEDGTAGVPVAWANVWTTNDRVELWI